MSDIENTHLNGLAQMLRDKAGSKITLIQEEIIGLRERIEGEILEKVITPAIFKKVKKALLELESAFDDLNTGFKNHGVEGQAMTYGFDLDVPAEAMIGGRFPRFVSGLKSLGFGAPYGKGVKISDLKLEEFRNQVEGHIYRDCLKNATNKDPRIIALLDQVAEINNKREEMMDKLWLGYPDRGAIQLVFQEFDEYLRGI